MSVPEALHCGVYGYLNKPFRAAELELILLRLAERQASHSFQDAASGLYHRTGFAVLAQQQLRAARRTFRDADMAGRVDGTDCGVLLVDAGVGQTDIALRRLQRNLAAHNARVGEGQQLKVRVGVAHFNPGQPCSFEELVAEADAATRPRDTGV
jgi:GGDEF domain-containing protein